MRPLGAFLSRANTALLVSPDGGLLVLLSQLASVFRVGVSETVYSDDLADEEPGLSSGTAEEEEDIDDEMEEEPGLVPKGQQQGSGSGSIVDETETSSRHAAGAQRLLRAGSESVVSEEPVYSDSFGSAPPQSLSVTASGGGGSGLSGMTEMEAEHALRIAALKKEVELKKRQASEEEAVMHSWGLLCLPQLNAVYDSPSFFFIMMTWRPSLSPVPLLRPVFPPLPPPPFPLPPSSSSGPPAAADPRGEDPPGRAALSQCQHQGDPTGSPSSSCDS